MPKKRLQPTASVARDCGGLPEVVRYIKRFRKSRDCQAHEPNGWAHGLDSRAILFVIKEVQNGENQKDP